MPLERGMVSWLVKSVPARFHLFCFYAAGSAPTFVTDGGKMKNCSLVAQTENTRLSRMLSLRHTMPSSAGGGGGDGCVNHSLPSHKAQDKMLTLKKTILSPRLFVFLLLQHLNHQMSFYKSTVADMTVRGRNASGG